MLFDPAQAGWFAVDAPAAPWVDLGWCTHWARKSETKVVAVRGGAPAMTQMQARSEIEATLTLEFASWGKLQLAVASGSQQMNLLATAAGAAAGGSGGLAASATPLQSGSTATTLQVGSAASSYAPGSWVVVDVDYTGQTGYVGAGISGAYVRQAADVNSDVNYIRRVSLNVAQVAAVSGGALQLQTPLPAGAPTAGMQVCAVTGFVDREGGNYFQEWSGLFCLEGEQGDRVLFHYPRLQSMSGSAEAGEVLAGPLTQMKLAAQLRALPVTDASDGAQVVCFRSYLPKP
ncbi:MAG: hypothetical protein KGK08_04595 [Acidobacteriota bacterium]|nr:hypothetical protein [Acidobacteriota bacterium]